MATDPAQVFDGRALRAALSSAAARSIDAIDVVDTIDSTNTALLAAAPPGAGRWNVLIANEQTAGKGRGGKRWHSPPGGGLWMSAAYAFPPQASVHGLLTLALGIASAKALRKFGLATVKVKWPNDIVVEGRKLAGLLVEARSAHPVVVCGIGLNLDLGDAQGVAEAGALPPTDLKREISPVPSTATLAAALLDGFIQAQQRLADNDTDSVMRHWAAFDWLAGKQVTANGAGAEWTGIARGIDEDGSLRIDVDGQVKRLVAGSVRPRVAEYSTT